MCFLSNENGVNFACNTVVRSKWIQSVLAEAVQLMEFLAFLEKILIKLAEW